MTNGILTCRTNENQSHSHRNCPAPTLRERPTERELIRRRADAAAELEFRRDPFRLDESDDRPDAVSLAWEITQRGKSGSTDWKLAVWHAWRDIRWGRVRLFPESALSVTCERSDRGRLKGQTKRKRTKINMRKLPDHGHPAADCPLRLDVLEWLGTLPYIRRRIAELLGLGFTTAEISHHLDRTAQTINAHISRLRASWEHFVSLSRESAGEAGNPLQKLIERLRSFADRLAPRELEVMDLLLFEGLDIADIATRLQRVGRTVSHARERALRKLGATPDERRAAVDHKVRRSLLSGRN